MKELFQKVESKHRDEKQKGKDEKIEESIQYRTNEHYGKKQRK